MSDIVDNLSDYIRAGFDPHNQLKEARSEIERLRAENEEQSFFIVKGEKRELALQSENARLREALEDHVRAAECIRHWHDTLGDEGMVVSAEHVRLLWEATSRARAALAEKENSNV